jgi:hypothetical protein
MSCTFLTLPPFLPAPLPPSLPAPLPPSLPPSLYFSFSQARHE